jgi:hypothetical protein
MNPNTEKALLIKGRFGLGWADWECAIPAWLAGGFGVFEAQPASRRLQRRTQAGKPTDCRRDPAQGVVARWSDSLDLTAHSMAPGASGRINFRNPGSLTPAAICSQHR